MPAVADFDEEKIDFVMRAWLASRRSNKAGSYLMKLKFSQSTRVFLAIGCVLVSVIVLLNLFLESNFGPCGPTDDESTVNFIGTIACLFGAAISFLALAVSALLDLVRWNSQRRIRT